MPYHQVLDADNLHSLLDTIIASDLDLEGVLRQIVGSAVELAGARYGAVGVLDPAGTGLSDFVYVGIDAATAKAIGPRPTGRGLLGVLITDPRPIRRAVLGQHPRAVGVPAGHPPMRSFLGVPIRVRGQVYGNLYLTDKAGGAEFTDADEQMVTGLASAAGIAIDNARLHARVRELTLSDDRERIARDLHDTVIQRVYAVALSLQAAAGISQDPDLTVRLHTAVDDLDETIRQIRTTIFALEPPLTAQTGLRAQALQICAEAARSLGFEPEFRFTGPVDLTPGHIGLEAQATLREALSNVARHARAHTVKVTVGASATELRLEVTDDGVGPAGPAHGVGKGLANMADRAQALDGSFRVSARARGGTRLQWRVPLA